MRFKAFINESTDLDLEQFAEECSPWLSRVDVTNTYDSIPWHGSKAIVEWQKLVLKKAREPKDTPKDLSNRINDFFAEQYGGWRAREQSIFASDQNTAKMYGTPFAIFPIGEFKTLWSPDILDVTYVFDLIRSGLPEEYGIAPSSPDGMQIAKDRTLQLIKDSPWRFNDGISECIKKGCELMIGCESCYAICSSMLFTRVMPFLRGRNEAA